MSDMLIVLATLLSPLIAIQVSAYLQDRREKRDRRFRAFQILMATRAANLTPEHVEALNIIDVAYYGTDRKSKDVVEAHKVYLDHLNRPTALETWSPRREELMVDLLQKMAVSLGYDFDKVTIRRTAYNPQGFGDRDWESLQIRQLVLALLKGERWLPVYAMTQQESVEGSSASHGMPASAAVTQAAAPDGALPPANNGSSSRAT